MFLKVISKIKKPHPTLRTHPPLKLQYIFPLSLFFLWIFSQNYHHRYHCHTTIIGPPLSNHHYRTSPLSSILLQIWERNLKHPPSFPISMLEPNFMVDSGVKICNPLCNSGEVTLSVTERRLERGGSPETDGPICIHHHWTTFIIFNHTLLPFHHINHLFIIIFFTS